jgi:hypothetical protein
MTSVFYFRIILYEGNTVSIIRVADKQKSRIVINSGTTRDKKCTFAIQTPAL